VLFVKRKNRFIEQSVQKNVNCAAFNFLEKNS